MKAELRVGIIGAMNIEIERLASGLESREDLPINGFIFLTGSLCGQPVVIGKSGIGKVNAAICTQMMIDRFRLDCLLNTGIAGGLDPTLSIGDVVVAQGLLQHDFDVSAFGHARGYMCTGQGNEQPTVYHADARLVSLLEKTAAEFAGSERVRRGLVATGDQFISGKEKKSELYREFSAVAADMEGGAIAQTAYFNGVPFAVIRTVSDLADGTAAQSYDAFEKEAAEISAAIITDSIREIRG